MLSYVFWTPNWPDEFWEIWINQTMKPGRHNNLVNRFTNKMIPLRHPLSHQHIILNEIALSMVFHLTRRLIHLQQNHEACCFFTNSLWETDQGISGSEVSLFSGEFVSSNCGHFIVRVTVYALNTTGNCVSFLSGSLITRGAWTMIAGGVTLAHNRSPATVMVEIIGTLAF